MFPQFELKSAYLSDFCIIFWTVLEMFNWHINNISRKQRHLGKNLFGNDVTNGANLNHPMQLYFFKKAVAVVFRFAKTR